MVPVGCNNFEINIEHIQKDAQQTRVGGQTDETKCKEATNMTPSTKISLVG